MESYNKVGFKIIENMSSDEYHSIADIYSSSQLKTCIDDGMEMFYSKYILKEIERESIAAFDVGTYFHTAILEPEKLTDECQVVPCSRRAGKEWTSAKELNQNKVLITTGEFEQAENLIKAVHNSKVATDILSKGVPEISAMGVVTVDSVGDIYHEIHEGTLVKLSPTGWVISDKTSVSGTNIALKVRADLLAEDYIVDLKSTTGNAKDKKLTQEKVAKYNYDLSASLYLDLFSLAKNSHIEKFIWIFASKDTKTCKCWEADREHVAIGRAKWRKAVVMLARAIESNWKFEDKLEDLPAKFWEKEWLKEFETTSTFKKL